MQRESDLVLTSPIEAEKDKTAPKILHKEKLSQNSVCSGQATHIQMLNRDIQMRNYDPCDP